MVQGCFKTEILVWFNSGSFKKALEELHWAFLKAFYTFLNLCDSNRALEVLAKAHFYPIDYF